MLLKDYFLKIAQKSGFLIKIQMPKEQIRQHAKRLNSSEMLYMRYSSRIMPPQKQLRKISIDR